MNRPAVASLLNDHRTTSVAASAALLSFAGVAYGTGQWLTLMLLVKHVDTAAFGAYVYVVAVATPLFAFLNLNLRQVYLAGTDGARQVSTAEFLTARLATTATAVAVAIIICAATSSRQWGLIAGVVFAKAFDSIGDLVYGIAQKVGKVQAAVTGPALNAVLTLALGGGAAVVYGSAGAAAVGSMIASAIVLFCHDLPLLRSAGLRLEFRGCHAVHVVAVIRRGFPFGTAVGLSTIQPHFPRYFLKAVQGEAALGAYGALAAMLVPIEIVSSAVTQSSIRPLAELRGRPEERAVLLSRLTFAIAGAAAVLFAIAATLLLAVLPYALGPSYPVTSVTVVTLVLATSIALTAAPASAFAISNRESSTVVRANGVAVIVGLIASAVFVPHLGIQGAATAAVLMAVSKVAMLYSHGRDMAERLPVMADRT